MKILSVIIPAHDEAALIGHCLTALLASDPLPEGWRGEVLVVANGCADTTAAVAGGYNRKATAHGWDLQVIDVVRGGKLNALNIGDQAAKGDIRAYLDADVTVGRQLARQLVVTLDGATPRYASGQPRVSPAQSRVTRWYGRFWSTLPFMQSGVPGFGVFAVNAAGRARWGRWPDIISDDTFARLNFAPAERVRVSALVDWPMVEGMANLIRVRRRQNDGVTEIARMFPDLRDNDDKTRLTAWGLLRRAFDDPLGFATYLAVSLAVKTPLFRSDKPWARGR